MNETLKFDLVSAHIRSVHPDWSADRVFIESIEASGHQGTFGRDTSSNVAIAEASGLDGCPKLVRGGSPPNKKADRHPAIIEELSKHWQLEQARKKWGEVDHAIRLAKIRKLMEADPSLSFDAAFTRIIQEETVVAPDKAALKTSQSAANENSKVFLVKGSEHGMRYPIFK
jgi:hypothetical protein